MRNCRIDAGIPRSVWLTLAAIAFVSLGASDAHAQLIPGIDPFTQDYVVLGADGITASPTYNPGLVNPGVYDPIRDSLSALHTEQAKRNALANHARAVRQYWQHRNALLKQTPPEAAADGKDAPSLRQRMEAARIKATGTARQEPLVVNNKVFQRPSKDELHPKTGAIQWPPVLQTEFFKPYRDQLDALFAKRASGKEPIGVNSANYQMIEVVAHAMSQEMHTYASGIPQAEYLEGLSFLNKLAYEAQQIGPDLTNLPAKPLSD